MNGPTGGDQAERASGRQNADPAEQAAYAIHRAYVAYHDAFLEITRRARHRFEVCDWHGDQADALERLELYPQVIGETVEELRRILGPRTVDEALWQRIKRSYGRLLHGEPNIELEETFFNSVTRRVLKTVGINAAIEFVALDARIETGRPASRVWTGHESIGDTRRLIRDILTEHGFFSDPRLLERQTRLVAGEIERYLGSILGLYNVDSIETCSATFYRDRAAYIIGRICCGERIVPLVLALRNGERGIRVDAVLMDANDISILFSFTRSYFHVETDCPRELIVFLRSIMPLKPVAELYIALGFNKHGKTELYRHLRQHLRRFPDRFEYAEGSRGMVMMVFTLPRYDGVFKVIRDRFEYPKQTTRDAVMDRYRLVFQRDRVGRLVDAHEFEHLTFSRDRFADDLLAELLEEAGQTVSLEGDRVVIKHLYTERKIAPLNLYLRRVSPPAAWPAVVDYGRAIKELAAANIFPGDFLLKNFGVTRHGRVVFYDYDELCLLTDCNFRRIPEARNPEDELAAEPWFTVGPDDIFPEEFRRFLGMQDAQRDLFERYHGDLFDAEYWRGIQRRLEAGEILDFYPYPQERRLPLV